MLVEMPRTDGVDEPVLVPGNPVKLSKVAEGPETRVPWVGEHTDAVLADELGLDDADHRRPARPTASSPADRCGVDRVDARWRARAPRRSDRVARYESDDSSDSPQGAPHGLRVLARAARVRRRGRGVPRRQRRPRRLRRDPREHGADRRHARSAGRSWRKLGEQGWLGITWPKEYGGRRARASTSTSSTRRSPAAAARRSARASASSARRSSRHGSDDLKQEFLPKILRNEVEFAVGYSEPNAGSDAASMQLKAERAERDGDGWLLNGQKTWTTSAHFAEWYWLGTRTDPEQQAPRHHADARAARPARHHHQRRSGRWATSAPTRCSSTTCSCPTSTSSASVNRGFQYISQALDLERFTMFTFSPIKQRLDLLCDYVRTDERDGEPLRDDPVDPPAASRSSPPRPRSRACSGCGSSPRR